MKRKLGPKGQIVIPKQIRDALGLREGMDLEFRLSGSSIVLEPESSPEETVERFLSTPGPKLRKRFDLKGLLDEEYKIPRAK